jgi:Flp pilus assembly protein TadD
MAFGTLAAVTLLAQAMGPAIVNAPTGDRVDVGYDELAQGRPDLAIERIRANRELSADDPAALINLGTAHVRIGRPDEAQTYFKAAIISSERQDLELADGRWMNSRRAARLALGMMPKGKTFAVR